MNDSTKTNFLRYQHPKYERRAEVNIDHKIEEVNETFKMHPVCSLSEERFTPTLRLVRYFGIIFQPYLQPKYSPTKE